MLDLIGDHMLVVNKKERYPADVVCREILSIVIRLRTADVKSTLLPAIRISHEHSDSWSRNELLEPRVKGSSNLRHLRVQKECKTKPSRLLEQHLVPHIEDYWDSRLSSSGLDSAMGNSSNDDSADEVAGPMTPDSISLDDNPASKHETEIDIKEWRLDGMSKCP
ncbi:hypothetical protein RRF57_006598 [Xylaria bambusicola]|uniref:Uncharacterized protein n=1 Tax=Xylaria bambusicola TaxID=326684 RepID=A0AAN7UJK4_9PEZI